MVFVDVLDMCYLLRLGIATQNCDLKFTVQETTR